jgi:hypothetical protein
VKSLVDLLFGRPLKEESREKVGPAAGVAIFGLGSAAYGPEAALTMLIPLGARALNYILPISVSIIALLCVGISTPPASRRQVRAWVA